MGLDLSQFRDSRELEGIVTGGTALLLGGGPSLPAQLKAAPRGFKISINQHGCIVTRCDASLSLDRKPVYHTRKAQPDIVVFHPKPEYADIQLTEFQHLGNSTMTAVWLADYMGFSKIIPLGIDMYAGGTYFWDAHRQVAGSYANAQMHLDAWRKVKKHVPGHYKIRVMGGPLAELFPLYRKGERIEVPQVKPEPIKMPRNMRYIHCLRTTRAGNQTVEQGGCYWVHMTHAAILVDMGKAEYAEPPEVKEPKAEKPKKKRATKKRAASSRS